MKHIKKFEGKEVINMYNLRRKIEEILDNNIEDIPYEGKEIDKEQIIDDFIELINNFDFDKDVFSSNNSSDASWLWAAKR